MDKDYIKLINELSVFDKYKIYMHYVTTQLSFNCYPHIIKTAETIEEKIPILINEEKGYKLNKKIIFKTEIKYFNNPYNIMSFIDFIDKNNLHIVDYGTHKVINSKYLDIYYWYWRFKEQIKL